jgi:hypothetical protein
MSEKWEIIVTDTFGGEPNFCWVRKYSIVLDQAASKTAIVRRIKKAAHMSGCRGASDWIGDGYRFRPYGAPIILLANYVGDVGDVGAANV